MPPAALATVMLVVMTLGAPAHAAEPERKTVLPVESDAPLVNPDQGWGLWAGPRYYDGRLVSMAENTTGFGDDAPLFSWVLIDWMWADLQPERDRYDWQALDQLMQYWARRGKQIYLRVWVTDDDGWNGAAGSVVVPNWVWDAGAPYHEYLGEGHSQKREPDYAAPTYQTIYLPLLKSFLSALSARYDGDSSPLTTWGVMGFGNWGEWHTLRSHYPWPNRDVKHQVLAQLVTLYDETYKKPKIIAFPHDYDYRTGEVKTVEEFLYRQAHDLSTAKGFGLGRHAFIDGLGLVDYQMMERYWRTNPIFAEGNWSYTDMKRERSHGTFEENLDVMLRWHPNWAHFYTDAASYQRELSSDRATLERGLKPGGLGCRIVPIQLSWPATLPAGHLLVLRSDWVNRNAGRCIVWSPLSLSLVDRSGAVKFLGTDSAFDATHWIEGEGYPMINVFKPPKDLPAGTYQLRIAITDHAGKPRFRLPIAGENADLSYTVGTIDIGKTDAP